MPKRPVTIIAHSVLTDHRIVKTKDQPFPTALFNSSRPLQSGLIHLNAVPGKPDRIPALTLFRAFAELAPQDAAYRPNYLQSLDQAARTDGDHPDVLSALAWMHLAAGPRYNETKAFDELSRAVAGGTTRAADYEKLADLLSKSARTPEAISVLEKGIKLAPYEERLYKKLSLVYISDRQYGKALEAMRRTVQLFPEDGFMRGLLLKAEQGSATSGR
jgi:tetratricopeptide (TPR) repeat protein